MCTRMALAKCIATNKDDLEAISDRQILRALLKVEGRSWCILPSMRSGARAVISVSITVRKRSSQIEKKKPTGIYPAPAHGPENCTFCKSCEFICPELAITVEKEREE